jgi:asparagine N-glycosylation enzyme membrane subunit Stt3
MKILVPLVLISILIIAGCAQQQYVSPTCNETISYGCKYDGTLIMTSLETLFWMKENIPAGSTFINWWDYGKEIEKVSGMNTVIKNPSKSLEISTGCYNAKLAGKSLGPECDTQQFDPEENVKDVATFLTTSNETEALCIASKYNASYVLVTGADIFKYYWIDYAAGGVQKQSDLFIVLPKTSEYTDSNGILVSRNYGQSNVLLYNTSIPIYVQGTKALLFDEVIYFNNSVLTSVTLSQKDRNATMEALNPWIKSINLEFSNQSVPSSIFISKDYESVTVIPPALRKSIFTNLIMLEGQGTEHFKEIYNSSDSSIFEMTFDGITCPTR